MALQQTMQALSDGTRRGILMMLRAGAMTAGEIAGHFNMSQAAVSKHLSVLRAADLVRCRREGKYMVYELNASVLEEVLLWVTQLKGEKDHEA